MMWLKPAQAWELERLAREGAPNEVCGLLLGNGVEIIDIVPIPNAAEDAQHAFRLEERAFVREMFAAEKRGLSLAGFFHSHPSGIALPSQTDIQQSHYPDALHLIVGLGGQPLMNAWRLANGGAERVELIISDAAPVTARLPHEGGVIVLCAFVAVLILIVLSLALLPPAPPLPAP
jgi:proteasome lid subunit RPN8/RPN11